MAQDDPHRLRSHHFWSWFPGAVLTVAVVVFVWLWMRAPLPIVNNIAQLVPPANVAAPPAPTASEVPNSQASTASAPATAAGAASPDAGTPSTPDPAIKPATPNIVSTGQLAGWRIGGATLDTDAAEAPDSTRTAIKLTEDSAIGWHGVAAVINIDSTRSVSASVSARHGNGRRLELLVGAGLDQFRCDVDLETGLATRVATGGAEIENCGALQENAGWWRVQVTGQLPASAGERLVKISSTHEPFNSTYQGNGKGFILIWKPAVSQ